MKMSHTFDVPGETAMTPVEATRGSIFTRWLEHRSVDGKLLSLAWINALALTISLAATVIGGWWSLDLRAQRMAITEATVNTSWVAADLSQARLHAQRFVISRDSRELTASRDALTQAKRNLANAREGAEQATPGLVASIDALDADIGSLKLMVTQAQSAAGNTQQWQRFSDGVSRAGTDMAGSIVDIRKELDSVREALDLSTKLQVSWLFAAFGMVALIGITTVLLGAKVIRRDIARTIGAMTDSAVALAQGDRNAAIPSIHRADELGELARALDVFRENALRVEELAAEREAMRDERKAELARLAATFESTVGEVVQGVAAASAQLNSTAGEMAAVAQQATQQSEAVSQSMESASGGVTAAAAASDEFAMSIGEISRQATHSSELARKASSDAQQADATIAALSDAANQVGQIVELIQSIAQRTNLLALNASIEAARGGEAGRGFAVVASEVKELAAQTSRATEEVAQQIRSMQDSTGESVGALRSIGQQIKQLETIAVSIASAVDQQSVAGQDLARSIDVAARSTDEVSGSVAQVRQASMATGAAASQVLGSASSLEAQAGTLRDQVDRFLQHVKAA